MRNIKKLLTHWHLEEPKICKRCSKEYYPTRTFQLFCRTNCRVMYYRVHTDWGRKLVKKDRERFADYYKEYGSTWRREHPDYMKEYARNRRRIGGSQKHY